MATVYERAFLHEGAEGCLPDRLTVVELAQLRAGCFDGADQQTVERLATRMVSQANAGLLVLGERVEVQRTGCWLLEVPKKDNYGHPVHPIEYITQRIERLMGGVPSDAVAETETILHRDAVTREAALALMKVDPENWSDGARRWLGAPLAALSAHKLIVPTALDAGDDEFVSTSELRGLLVKVGYNAISINAKLGHPKDTARSCKELHGCYCLVKRMWLKNRSLRGFSRLGLEKEREGKPAQGVGAAGSV